MPVAEVQASLRGWFRQWGCPGLLQVDNGHPWGSSRDLPPVLALWLLGLGVAVAWIKPNCPEANGVIENSQGTGQRWVETARCATVAEVQQRADEEDQLQREAYPLADGRSRWATYPWLCHSGRGYTEGWERGVWCLDLVLRWLADRRLVRQVDRQGQISVYGWNRLVGRGHGGKEVRVQLAAESREWVVYDGTNSEIQRWPAEELSVERICSLRVARERHPGQRLPGAGQQGCPNRRQERPSNEAARGRG